MAIRLHVPDSVLLLTPACPCLLASTSSSWSGSTSYPWSESYTVEVKARVQLPTQTDAGQDIFEEAFRKLAMAASIRVNYGLYRSRRQLYISTTAETGTLKTVDGMRIK